MRVVPRGIAVVAVGAAAALVLSGCGRSDEAPQASSSAVTIDDEAATGEVQVWAFGAEGEALAGLAEKFEAENPDVDVVVTPVPNEELPRKVEAAVATGDVPDIVQPSTALPSYVATGGLAPVPDGLVEESDFFPAAYDSTVVDGVSYGVPWYVNVQALFYNAELAQQAGVEAPTTWEELAEFGKGLHDAGADRGLLTPSDGENSWQVVLGYIYQAGGDVLDGDQFTLNTPEVVTALEQYSSLFESGVSDPAYQPELGELPSAIANGDLGAGASGSFLYDYLVDAAGSAEKIGVSALPAGPENNDSYLGGSGLSVFTDAPNPDAAWKFIRFLAQPESQQEFYDAAGVLPASLEAWETGQFADDPVFQQFHAQLESSRATPQITTWTQIRSVISKAAEQIARGQLSPQDAAAKMQADAESIGTGD